MECEYLSKCAFLKKADKLEPFIVKMIKMSYCIENKCECARYKLSLSVPEKDIPDDLWPNSEEGTPLDLVRATMGNN